MPEEQQHARKRVRRLYLMDYALTPDRRIDNCAILCEDANILAIGGKSAFQREDGIEIYDFENCYATPGFIDTHIHGAGGFDSSGVDGSVNGIDAMSRILSERGVTGFVPTVVAAPRREMLDNLACLVRLIRGEPLAGAEALGINLEGPFLNQLKRGAQLADAILEVDLGFARELVAASGGLLKCMTFAPELANSVALVELLREHNIMPSMGHSVAGEKDTLRAIDAGARRCTHLFNGMPALHQREMSLTNIALMDDRVSVELIIDGRHIHPRMVDMACRCKPLHKIIGISDCTMAAGMPDGAYHIGPSAITVRDGFSQTAPGVLAGTTTMLDAGWHCLMSSGHLSEINAAPAVSRSPAESIGLEDRGVLLPGKRADLAFFERGSNVPVMTVIRGEIVCDSGRNVKVSRA